MNVSDTAWFSTEDVLIPRVKGVTTQSRPFFKGHERTQWLWSRENARAPFSGVNFSHVDAISGASDTEFRLLAVLRGERNEFSHSLDPLLPVETSSHIGGRARKVHAALHHRDRLIVPPHKTERQAVDHDRQEVISVQRQCALRQHHHEEGRDHYLNGKDITEWKDQRQGGQRDVVIKGSKVTQN